MKSQNSKKLGTFAGVFTPSVLTILGIILFMRMGYVVGSAGFAKALLIICLANLISILTSISLSAIATNIKVKGGGDYYLISRTLGVEFGGAIGIVLFLAQSVSIAFYCVGFGEAVSYILPYAAISSRLIAAVAVLFLFVFAWMGANWATKFQYGVMALVIAGLVSFYVGGVSQWQGHVFSQNWHAPAQGAPFWILFAIFFPAVTGFTQGVSMSGDLEDPGKSLPLGTFLAVGISIAVYFSVAVVFAGALSNDILMTDYSAMKKIARQGIWIDAGVIAATLSSAMASFMGAPRILQSLAGDRVFNILSFFAKGHGPSQNPRRGVLLAAGIAFATLSLGRLNIIAQVVSMFFLISYGLLNYATYYEAKAASPSFRPKFRWFDFRYSLVGFLSCLAIMLAIDIKNGLIAIAILFGIYQYLKRTANWSRWADGTRSYHLQQLRIHLLAAGEEPEHARDWRPQLLAFTNDPQRRIRLLEFAQWIEGQAGVTTAVQILVGEGVKIKTQKQAALKALSEDIAKNNLSAFPQVITTTDFNLALNILAQTYGVGPLHANTILVNWFDQLGKGLAGIETAQYTENIRMMFRMGCNILILNTDAHLWEQLKTSPPETPLIDIWWQNNATGRLMLMFAYLMTRSEPWADAKIRLLVRASQTNPEKTKADLHARLEEFRINAVPEMVDSFDCETVAEKSKNTVVMFYPFKIRNNRLTDVDGLSLERILKNVAIATLTMAAEDVDLTAEPEEGAAGELAQAVDALHDARKKEKAAKKEFDAAKENLVYLKTVRENAPNENVASKEQADLQKLENEIAQAEAAAEKAQKKAAKATGIAQLALADAVKLGYEEADTKGSSNG